MMRRIVITGAAGLLGWHAAAHVHARNCAARFKGNEQPFDLVCLDRSAFEDDARLAEAVSGADAIVHFAGINRGTEDEVETGNSAIAQRLADAVRSAGSTPHIVYANSTHAASDTPYGRGKRIAGEILARATDRYSDMVLPHIFGEGARPFYNNVTATLIAQILAGETPSINPDGRVELLHAGAAVETALQAIETGTTGPLRPQGRPLGVPALYDMLSAFHAGYEANIYPDLADDFEVALFNSYRAATYPAGWPRALKLNSDQRGTLFEAVKGGGGGQCFLSTTEPGVTRGDHFHLSKVERFLVVQGEAIIRMRQVLRGETLSFEVNGEQPAAVDMPTLWTHSIENVGKTPLLTLFWTHDLFDPANPDTYADPVLTPANAG